MSSWSSELCPLVGMESLSSENFPIIEHGVEFSLLLFANNAEVLVGDVAPIWKSGESEFLPYSPFPTTSSA